MTAPSFTMKLATADGHLRALDDAVAEFLATIPVRGCQRVCGRPVHRARRLSAPTARGLLMLTGDAVHNLRSALDHLAWSLAGASADRHTEFPIFIDEAKFRDKGRTKMRGMPSQAKKIIKSLQPYKRPHGLPEEKEPLWLLQSLDIEDKHRTLNLVASGVMGRLHVSTNMDRPEFGLTGATGFMPFADGAVILRIPAPRLFQSTSSTSTTRTRPSGWRTASNDTLSPTVRQSMPPSSLEQRTNRSQPPSFEAMNP
jgi:hypothetical protein